MRPSLHAATPWGSSSRRRATYDAACSVRTLPRPPRRGLSPVLPRACAAPTAALPPPPRSRVCPNPECGPGVFMASHFDRQYCGKCGLTYMFDEKDKKPPPSGGGAAKAAAAPPPAAKGKKK